MGFFSFHKKTVTICIVANDANRRGADYYQALNAVCKDDIIPHLAELERANPDIKFKLQAVSASNGMAMYPAPQDLAAFHWSVLTPAGEYNLGSGLGAAESTMKKLGGQCALILLTDGEMNDAFGMALRNFREKDWFRNACRIAVKYGEQDDHRGLSSFTGSHDTVFRMEDGGCSYSVIKSIADGLKLNAPQPWQTEKPVEPEVDNADFTLYEDAAAPKEDVNDGPSADGVAEDDFIRSTEPPAHRATASDMGDDFIESAAEPKQPYDSEPPVRRATAADMGDDFIESAAESELPYESEQDISGNDEQDVRAQTEVIDENGLIPEEERAAAEREAAEREAAEKEAAEREAAAKAAKRETAKKPAKRSAAKKAAAKESGAASQEEPAGNDVSEDFVAKQAPVVIQVPEIIDISEDFMLEEDEAERKAAEARAAKAEEKPSARSKNAGGAAAVGTSSSTEISFIFVADSSPRLTAEELERVDKTIKKLNSEIHKIAAGSERFMANTGLLRFSGDLNEAAEGEVSVPHAFSMLGKRLSDLAENGFGYNRCCAVVVLISNGKFNDGYAEALSELWENPAFAGCTKISLANGSGADRKNLSAFAGSREGVITDTTSTALRTIAKMLYAAVPVNAE